MGAAARCYVLASTMVFWCACAWAQSEPDRVVLPLGDPGLPQSAHVETVLPGVVHYRFQRGMRGTADWQLTSGIVATGGDAQQVRACFAALGIATTPAAYQMGNGPQARYTVYSGGAYPTKADGAAVERRAAAMHCPLFARLASDNPSNRSGPWTVDLVVVAPDSKARLAVVAGPADTDVRRRVSTLARQAGAVAAVNGGFFVRNEGDGLRGQPAGISILSGRLNSGPVNLRPAAMIGPGNAARIQRKVDVSAYLLWSDGARMAVDGIARQPGLVRQCGRDAQDPPAHDFTCSYADDVVFFPPGSAVMPAAASLPASIFKFALGTDGILRPLAPGGLPEAHEGLLAVTSASARLPAIVRARASGRTASFKADSTLEGAFAPGVSLVNGGPTLLRDGKEMYAEAEEGWRIGRPFDAKHDLLVHDWIQRRAPRTAIGVRADGVVLLVAVTGRQPEASVGMTIDELRHVLKALGARDAINLDGGGSTAMVVKDRLLTVPSDPDGERAVGDAIVVLPAG